MAANEMAWTRFSKKKDMPGGLWIKCDSCGSMLFRKEFEQRHRVCQSCNYHFTLPARERVASLSAAVARGEGSSSCSPKEAGRELIGVGSESSVRSRSIP